MIKSEILWVKYSNSKPMADGNYLFAINRWKKYSNKVEHTLEQWTAIYSFKNGRFYDSDSGYSVLDPDYWSVIPKLERPPLPKEAI
jgi:hypothetical protein